MEIKEKGNLLLLYLSKNDEVITSLANIVREYLIIDAKISGFGYFNRTEYGILEESDPIFFKKFLCENLATAPNLFGMVQNREVQVLLNSVDKENVVHSGRLFSAIVELESILVLDILKTD